MSETFIEKIPSDIRAKKIIIRKGDNLFLQGTRVINIYSLLEGRIKLVRNTTEGEQIVVHVAVSGETFAEASLFSREFHCSAVADSEAVISSYKKAELLTHLEEHPATMRALLEIFSQQVRDLRAINEIKNIHSARERIMAYLRNEMKPSRKIALTISLKDTAYKIGLAHETFYRELKKLEQSGLLVRNDRYIELV